MSGITVLLVPAPEAETAIDGLRRRLDPTWRQGMPAHVTVLVPFMPLQEVDDAVVAELRALFAATPPVAYVLRRTNWFDDRVLYCEPEPAEPFRRMTEAVVERFPRYQPYEGAFESIVPHVTVGEGGRWRKRRRALRRAAAGLAGFQPIEATASEVVLMALDPMTERWGVVERFTLGAREPVAPLGAGRAMEPTEGVPRSSGDGW